MILHRNFITAGKTDDETFDHSGDLSNDKNNAYGSSGGNCKIIDKTNKQKILPSVTRFL